MVDGKQPLQRNPIDMRIDSCKSTGFGEYPTKVQRGKTPHPWSSGRYL